MAATAQRRKLVDAATQGTLSVPKAAEPTVACAGGVRSGVATHPSDSSKQRRAEPLILSGITAAIGVPLAPKRLALQGGAPVDVDGVADDHSILVEIFAHQGRLRGGQFHKVARDALKLITLARVYPDARLIIAFGDAVAAGCVTGKSWLAEAIRVWSIEVMVVELEDDVRDALAAAQLIQVMVNPPTSPVGDEP